MPTGPDETLVAAKKPKKRIRAGAVIGALLGAILVAAAALYVIGYFMAGENLPRNATIAGVAVGGLTPQQATERLHAELGPVAERPILVTIGDTEDQIEPVAAGMTVDYAASIAKAGGERSFDPRQIWRVLTGGGPLDPEIIVDEQKVAATVAELAAEHNGEPVDAELSFDGDTVVKKAGRNGVAVREADAATDLSSAYVASKAQGLQAPIALSTDSTEPAVTTDDVDVLATEYAEPAVSGPITIKAGSAGEFTISPEMLGNSISFVRTDGALAPDLDAKKLAKEAAKEIEKVELKKPKDATVKLEDGKPKVVPAVNGTEVGEEELAKAVESVITESGDARTADIELTGAKAKFSTEDARKLGINEVTGEFTTSYPHAEYRNVNIGRAAEKINGTVLKPGDVFSLNGIVGERTRENGFTEGGIISGGTFLTALGGGVSQSATTTYNAMFFAGLEDVEHKPHGLYIDRYPAGREATVAWPSLDLKFRNNTEYGVLVQAFVKKSSPGKRGSITVKMWSTKTWDKIESSELKKSNFTWGRERTNDNPNCQNSAPVQGFDVNYSRLFYKDGEVARKEDFFWRYRPTDKVTCTAN